MKFDGPKLRLQPGDIAEVARPYGLTEAHIRTVGEVETAGKSYDSLGQVAFLFEPHIFYKNVPKEKLQVAIQTGLAYPKWKGPGSYPKTPALRWAQFLKAVDLDETAAIKSASWGYGQIMGSEHGECDFASPQEMLTAFYQSEKEQIKAMMALIKHRGLDKDLKNFPDITACRHFALRYNGSGYEKNNYHNKLHDAFVRWSSRLKTVAQATHPLVAVVQPHVDAIPEHEIKDSTFRVGDHDEEAQDGPIWKMQELFKEKGYSLGIDGKFGPGTRAVALAWKGNQNMAVITPDMSVHDRELLAASGPMPVPAERASTTVADLKQSSTIVQNSSLGKKILGGTVGSLVTGQLADSGGLLDNAQSTMDKAQQAKGIFSQARELVVVNSGIGDLLHTVLQYKFEILVVAAVVGFILYHLIEKRRVEMHQNAEVA